MSPTSQPSRSPSSPHSVVFLVMSSLGRASMRCTHIISRIIGVLDANAIPGPFPVAVVTVAANAALSLDWGFTSHLPLKINLYGAKVKK